MLRMNPWGGVLVSLLIICLGWSGVQAQTTSRAIGGGVSANASKPPAGSAPVTNSGGITGTVKTSAGALVSGAVVSMGTSFVYTSATGTYTFSGLAAGSYTVTAQKPGYVFASPTAVVKVATTVMTNNFVGTARTGDGVVKYWAVVVGINNYKSLSALKYAVNDANDMVSALKVGGYPAANIKELTDSAATKSAIQSALAWMVTSADADDVCVFFQSGHGDAGPDVAPIDEADGKDEYLCPYDTNASDRTTEIRDDELGLWMSALKTAKYAAFIDACYGGGMIKATGAGWGSGFAHAVNDMTEPGRGHWDHSKDLDDLGTGVVVCACTDTQLSQESAGLLNGAFTYYLVLGLSKGAADTSKNGWYSVEEAYNYAAPLTHTYSPQQTVSMYDGTANGSLDFAKVSLTAAPGAKAALAVSGTAAATKSGASAIMVSLSAPATVTASILNLAGREVAVLGSQNLHQGLSTLLWNGQSRQGTSVPGGQYLVRLQARDAAGNSSNCLINLRK